MNKETLIKEITKLKKDTSDDENGLCKCCGMDYYDCDCRTFNYAIEKVLELISRL